MLTAISLSIIAAAVVWALAIVGTPETARKRELDRVRVDNLQSIRWAIDRFYQENGKLPESLQELELGPRASLRDPVTDEPYGYNVVDSNNYQLSANFALKNNDDHNWNDTDWGHSVGPNKFSFPTPRNGR